MSRLKIKPRKRARLPSGRLAPLAGEVVHMSLGRDKHGRFWWHEGRHNGVRALDSTAHGPFNTPEEAEADFRVTVFGPQCEFTEGGRWDPAWDRKH